MQTFGISQRHRQVLLTFPWFILIKKTKNNENFKNKYSTRREMIRCPVRKKRLSSLCFSLLIIKHKQKIQVSLRGHVGPVLFVIFQSIGEIFWVFLFSFFSWTSIMTRHFIYALNFASLYNFKFLLIILHLFSFLFNYIRSFVFHRILIFK